MVAKIACGKKKASIHKNRFFSNPPTFLIGRELIVERGQSSAYPNGGSGEKVWG